MSPISPKDELKITQFVNPHLFWVRKIDMDFDQNFTSMKQSLHKHYSKEIKENPWKTYKPKKGDLVAAFDKKDGTWFRAEVDDIYRTTDTRENDTTLWMIDYGRTIEIHSSCLRPLTAEFASQKFDYIIKAGIVNILPAEEEVDFFECVKKLVKCRDWSTMTVKKMQEALDDVPLVYFRSVLYDEAMDHHYGELTVHTYAGKEQNIRQNLLNFNAAIAVPQERFLKELNRTEIPVMPRNRDNSGYRISRNISNRNKISAAVPFFELDNASDQTQDVDEKVNTWFTKNKQLDHSAVPTVLQEESEETDGEPEPLPALVKNIADDDDDSESISFMSQDFQNRQHSDSEDAIVKLRKPKITTIRMDESDDDRSSNASESKLRCATLMRHLLIRRKAKENGEVPPIVPQDQPKAMNLIPHDYQVVVDTSRLQGTSRVEPPVVPPPRKTSSRKSYRKSASESGSEGKLSQIVRRIKAPPRAARSIHTETSTEDEGDNPGNQRVQTNYQNLIDCNLDETLTFQERSNAKIMVDENSAYQLTLDYPLVLAHGKRIEPHILSHQHANFSLHVMNFMKRYRDIRRIQSYAWPHIMNENSAVIIGNTQTGKTLSYVPAVCSLVDRLYDENEKDATEKGPFAIIIVPSSSEVNRVYRMCRDCFYGKTVATGTKMNFTVQAYANHKHEELENMMLEGAGILCVTPPCLNRLLENGVPLFTYSKVKIVVVDDYDVCLKRFGTKIDELVDTFYTRHVTGDPTQVIVVSNVWETSLLKYTQKGKNPALFISHYAESALYGGTKLKVVCKKKQEKLQCILDHLSTGDYTKHRTAILCATDAEVHQVSQELSRSEFINVLSYTSDSTTADREAALRWRNPTDRELPVLITSDHVLSDLHETRNIQTLINYSLPDTWFRLSMRFILFFDYYHNYVVNGNEPANYLRPFTLIMIDEQDSPDCFLRFMEFMKRTVAKIPQDCIKYAQQIMTDREIRRQSIRLCPYLLQFGECVVQTCRDRHTLHPYDKPTDRMPKEGTVLKLKLTHVHHPTHYSARILEYHAPGIREWQKWNEAFMEVAMKLEMYYRNNENLQSVGNDVSKGEVYTWIGEHDRYYRCKVIDVNISGKKSLEDQNLKVVLRLIDSGRIIFNQNLSSLVVLPDDLKAYPAQAFDVHLTGYVPYDGDITWDRDTIEVIQRTMVKHDNSVKAKDAEKDCYVQVTAHFVLEGNIWTNKISTVEFLKELQKRQEVFPIHKILMRQGVAERDMDDKGLIKIKELARQCGFFEKNNEKLKPTEQPHRVDPPKVQQARGTFDYLPQETLVPVAFQHFDYSGTFYLTKVECFDKIIPLFEFIDQFVADKEHKKRPRRCVTGKNCLAYFDDGYARCRILQQLRENPPKYEVYLCDTGSIEHADLDDMIETTDEITGMAPFAAIRGRLVGTLPKENYSKEDIDKMTQIVNDWENCLHARVTRMRPNEDDWNVHFGLNFYDILLVAVTDDETVLLNSIFVEKGILEADPEYNLADIDLERILKELPEGDGHCDSSPESEKESEDDWEHLVGTYERPAAPAPAPEKQETPIKIDDLYEMSDNDVDFVLELFQLGHLKEEVRKARAAQKKSEGDTKEKKPKAASIVSEKSGKTDEVKKRAKKRPTKSKKSEPETPVTLLKKSIKCPQVTWQQNLQLIYLSIRIGDVEDYYLEITQKDLVFNMIDLVDGEPRALVLNFFGVVDVNGASYDKCGLNLVVRLPKIGSFEWPRLQEMPEKFPYIKYNYDSLTVVDEFYLPKISKGNVGDSSDEFDDATTSDGFGEDFDDLDDPLADGF